MGQNASVRRIERSDASCPRDNGRGETAASRRDNLIARGFMRGIKRKIDLGPAVVSVEWKTDADMRAEAECDEDESAPDGLWDAERNRILLHVSLKKRPRYARQILLHELIHACCDLYHEVS